MDSKSFQLRIVQIRKSLFEQGYLDKQFVQLEELQDAENPNFVDEIVTSYYSDSARLIQKIEHALTKHHLDFDMLDNLMHQFKGSSSSIGARKVVHECSHFRDLCAAGNADGCIKSFQMIKQEHVMLRNKLEAYFQLINTT
ncbi:histidine-containing phosphotransfer protein 4-like [Silene latifolia]|uniref:histidine-containing phosphotransfer protein 4-like n=1 Tax=Silene latifolia TaxID=37657 RepID=UPI003D77E5E2